MTRDTWLEVCGELLVVSLVFALSCPAHPGNLDVFPSGRGDGRLTEFPLIVDCSHRLQPSSLHPADQPAALQRPWPLRLSANSSVLPENDEKAYAVRTEGIDRCIVIIIILIDLVVRKRGSATGTSKRKICLMILFSKNSKVDMGSFKERTFCYDHLYANIYCVLLKSCKVVKCL